jgi:hypothetical protein
MTPITTMTTITTMRLTAAMAVAAGLMMFAQTGPALACSCVRSSVSDQVAAADVVATGTLTKVTDPSRGDAVIRSVDPLRYRIDVDHTYKGPPAAQLTFVSARFGASCGLEGMQLDHRYRLFLQRDSSDRLSADLCGGTAPATAPIQTDIARVTGPPRAASAGQPASERKPGLSADSVGDTSWAAFWMGAIVVVGVGAAGFWWLRRSSRAPRA